MKKDTIHPSFKHYRESKSNLRRSHVTKQQTKATNTDSNRELSLKDRVAIYVERLAIEGNNVASEKDLCMVFKNDEAVHAWLDTLDIPRQVRQ